MNTDPLPGVLGLVVYPIVAWCLRSIRISKDPSNAPPERALAPFRLDRFAAADGGAVLSAAGTVAALAAIIELWS